jgi:hypothetical protein
MRVNRFPKFVPQTFRAILRQVNQFCDMEINFTRANQISNISIASATLAPRVRRS